MEESQLDYAAQASLELVEFLSGGSADEQDSLVQLHVQKLHQDASITPVFDPTDSKYTCTVANY